MPGYRNRLTLLPCLVHQNRYDKYVGDAMHYTSNADSELFRALCDNPQHVLANLFPQHKSIGHNLRSRVHSYTLPIKDANNFIPRMLYANIYQLIYV